MNEQMMKQAEEMIQAAQDMRVPENVQAFAEDSVQRTREVYERLSGVAQETTKAFEEITEAAQKGAKTLTEQLLENMIANTEAALDAAEAVVRAKTLPEAARVQADFWQQQLTKASEQTKAFYELSGEIAKTTFEQWNAVASKTLEQVKSSASN